MPIKYQDSTIGYLITDGLKNKKKNSIQLIITIWNLIVYIICHLNILSTSPKFPLFSYGDLSCLVENTIYVVSIFTLP